MSAQRAKDELVFTQSTSINEREKIKELWKFLDFQCDLEPYKPLQSREKAKLPVCTQDQVHKLPKNVEQSVSEEASSSRTISLPDDGIPDKDMIWYHSLRFFQKMGLDKAALSETKCKFCRAEKDFQDKNYPETKSQTYDELNAEIASFDERLANREDGTSNSTQN